MRCGGDDRWARINDWTATGYEKAKKLQEKPAALSVRPADPVLNRGDLSDQDILHGTSQRFSACLKYQNQRW